MATPIRDQNYRCVASGLLSHRLALCLLLVTCAPSQGQKPPTACPNGICAGLGNAFYLPDRNILDSLTGGRQIFIDRKLGSCIDFNPRKSGERQFDYYKDTFDFLSSTAGSAGVEASYNTMQLTLRGTFQGTTGYNLEGRQDIESLALDITTTIGFLDFSIKSDPCWSEANLDPKLKSAFLALPLIDAPADSVAWKPYIDFFVAWGTHIMTQQTLGSRFQQWESVQSAERVSQNTLQMKACADVEGLSEGGGWSLKTCGAYSADQKKAASQVATQERRKIVGGTGETRLALVDDVTPQTLKAFISSADQADEAVAYQFTPIWKLFFALYGDNCTAAKSQGCKNYQVALNLEAAYEGWLAVGCTTFRAILPPQVPIQVMKISSYNELTDIRTYGCWVEKLGCLDDRSCHANGFSCYCYGPGCITLDLSKPVGNPIQPRDYHEKLLAEMTGLFTEGVNKSCYYQFGAGCQCDKTTVIPGPPSNPNLPTGKRFIWEQSTNSSLRRRSKQ